MDTEKDIFIKQRFKEDELISKKANDVFKNFFVNDIKNLTINETENAFKRVEKVTEKVVELNEHKNKIFQRRKLMTAVASFMIVFLAANAYAATQGYNNIFFVIRNAFSKSEQITNPDEILEDKDTTISYQSIEIAKDLNIQINRLVVKENEASLYLNIQEGNNAENLPKKYVVYDITNGSKNLIGSQNSTRKLTEPLGLRYDEEIKLENMKNDTTKIVLEILNDSDEKIVEFEIDLNKKEIDIKEGDYASLQKISEVELKNILSKYCLLNYYNDSNLETDEKLLEKLKVNIAAEIMSEKELVKTGNKIIFTSENLNIGLEEIFGKQITSQINISEYVDYLNNEDYFGFYPSNEKVLGLCFEVTNISFLNGVYTVEYIYTLPTECDIESNNIEELPQYKSTIQFEINNEYKYTRYCLVNLEKVTSEKITEKNISEVNDKNSNEKENINEDEKFSNNTIISNDNISEETTTNSNNTNIASNSQNTKVDNYASSMDWSYYETNGLRFEYPTEWIIESSTANDGLGENFKLDIVIVSGVATGINKETNEIINSNVEFYLYEPENIYFNTAQDYANASGKLLGLSSGGTKFTSSKGVEWLEYSKRTSRNDGGNDFLTEYYNYNEITKMGTKVRMFTDREENYKVINILNRLLGSIEIK